MLNPRLSTSRPVCHFTSTVPLSSTAADPPNMRASVGPKVMFRLQLAMLPASPPVSSRTQRCHVPFTFKPLKYESVVPLRGKSGHGSAPVSKVSPSRFVGLNVPLASAPVPRDEAAASSRVMLTAPLAGGALVQLPTSDKIMTSSPSVPPLGP